MAVSKKTSASSKSSGTRKKSPSKGRSTKQTKQTRQTRQTGQTRTAKQTQQSLLSDSTKRMILGIVLLLLSGILVLTLLRMDGVLLSGIRLLLGGLIGKGIWLMCPALLFAGILLCTNAVSMRTRSLVAISMPVFFGALLQCISFDPLSVSFASVQVLWKHGGSLQGGGVLGGMLGTILSALISPFGTELLMLAFLTIGLFFLFQTTPLRLWHSLVQMIEEDTQQVQESDMTVTPSQKSTRTKKRKNLFVFLRDRRAKRKAEKLRREMEQEQMSDEAESNQPPIEPVQEVHPTSDVMEQFLKKQAAQKRLRDVMPPLPEDKPTFEPSIEVDGEAWDPSIAPWHTDADIPPQPEETKLPPAPDVPRPQPEPQETPVSDTQPQNPEESTDAEEEKPPMVTYLYPKLDLLKSAPRVSTAGIRAELKESSERLVDTLASFGIEVQIINVVRGPSVTRFELQMERGIKFSRITALSDDIALSLGADSVRIAPIPDKVAIGVEVPNRTVQMVMLRDVLSSPGFAQSPARLAVALGKDITGTDQIIDLAKMPHLLIAGTTGSGKSVCVNSILVSLLYKSSPEDVRLIMIDPKMVELGNYNGIPHLLIPVVTDPKKASGALNWAVGEMERRYSLFASNSVRNLEDYNAMVQQNGGQSVDGKKLEHLPQIVIVIDELADLMMVAAKEVETSICRIAQKARAAGMHLVVATQRPSADVITGIMKSNIPSRIAFAVASQVESRIILDGQGAEKLIGKGDMLYSPIGMSKPTRIQGCFVSSEEIESVISYVKSTCTAEYSEEIMAHIEREAEAAGNASDGMFSDADDELLPQAITICCEMGQASASMLQRKLKLGYSRAARLIDQMEERGIVGPSEGSKPRQVLLSREDWMQMQLRQKY